MNRLKGMVWILLCVCLATTAMFSQTSTGSISGAVTDPNGAVIPGAKVEARHVESGRTFYAVTTDAGIYVLPVLPVGVYSLAVEQAGFKKAVRGGIEVRVAIRLSIDLKLEIGDLAQSVEVKAEVPLLETSTPQRGQNLSPTMLSSLPIYNGGLRSAESFVGYMPGVNTNSETSINGSGGRGKEVMIDGASLTSPESGGLAMQFPGIEAFNEFTLVTQSYNAEYGRLGGGLELMVTKSGANQVHGAAFLNLKRDVLDAAGWANNQRLGQAAGTGKPKERYNEEGGAAGGPVYIPKIYDGRNKTFFYFTYVKDVRPSTWSQNANQTLPTKLMKQGNFSELSTLIYDPASTTMVNGASVRTPFAGNSIPQSRWSKISTNVINANIIPDPNLPGTTSNYSFMNTSAHNDYIYTIKIDHAFTQNHRFAFFMTRESQTDNGISALPGALSNGLLSGQYPDNYRGNYDAVLRPNLVVHTTFGFSRTQQTWNNPLQDGWASKIGLPLTGLADAMPVISFSGPVSYATWGMTQGKVNNGGQWNWTTEVNQQLTWIHGAHEVKAGWDVRRLRTIGDDWAGTNGSYGFSNHQTANPLALTTTGDPFASFLLGAADSGSATATPVSGNQIRYSYQSGFVQDTWKVRPGLTLTLGLRYEVPIGWHDVRGNYASFDPDKANPDAGNLPGALVFAGQGAARTGKSMLFPTDFSDIGPRLGFAYQPRSKTVIRGGWGIYYQTLGNGSCGCADGFNGQFSQNSDGTNQAFNWDQGGVKPPAGFKAPPYLSPGYDNFSYIDYLSPTFGTAGRIYSWSLTLQQEVKQFLFEAAYVGNRGSRLASTIAMNQLPTSYLSLGSLLTKNIKDPAVVAAGYKEPFAGFADGFGGSATLAQALSPYPQYSAVYDDNAGVGKTWYDALQTKVERRYGNWQIMATYTFSKSLGRMHYRQIFDQGSQVQAQDAYNLDDAKSYNPMDIPHFVNILNSYSLPFGHGKKFLSGASKLTDTLVGGWVIAGAQQYRSGTLIEITTPSGSLGSAIGSRLTKANYTGLPIRSGVGLSTLDPNNPTVRWFNFGSNVPFTPAPAYTLGTTSIYNSQFRNPMYRGENLSIVKNFQIWESVRFQYRADAINLMNRTDFGGVQGSITSAAFGRPTGAMVAPRVITMGLRLEF